MTDIHVKLHHFFENNYLLAIENFYLLFNLGFDKRLQTYQINYVKQSEKNVQPYFYRLSRATQSKNCKVFITSLKNIVIVTQNQVKYLNNSFQEKIIDLSQNDTISMVPDNIYRKIIHSYSKSYFTSNICILHLLIYINILHDEC